MAISLHAFALRHRALTIRRTLGLRTAAGFLRNRDVSLAEALFMLTGSTREAR